MAWTEVALAFLVGNFAASSPFSAETGTMIALSRMTTQLEPVR
ncbi:MAG: hypothetical protein AAFX92_00430 [Pseudomonadota bacterium]